MPTNDAPEVHIFWDNPSAVGKGPRKTALGVGGSPAQAHVSSWRDPRGPAASLVPLNHVTVPTWAVDGENLPRGPLAHLT